VNLGPRLVPLSSFCRSLSGKLAAIARAAKGSPYLDGTDLWRRFGKGGRYACLARRV
jgi:hypothetical protein